MPWLAPVTIATLPASPSSIALPFGCRGREPARTGRILPQFGRRERGGPSRCRGIAEAPRGHGSPPVPGSDSLGCKKDRGTADMAGHDDDHHHHHDHDHEHGSELSPMNLRVRALQSLLTAKGYIDTEALDRIADTYETRVGPRNGAAVVARAWTDPEFLDWLRRDATAAIHSMGFTGRQGEHMTVVENTPETHNMVVCTLCSCYPWPVLGLPPVWYKSAP